MREYNTNISIFFNNILLFDVEVGFAKHWNILKLKIDHKLTNEGTWGALVIKITEMSLYSRPTWWEGLTSESGESQ
jgi:hypothetical protein